jgi:2-polyprenyl-6-methoxyphenol hydroxylase-like FAD-dependent oxidoreductase
MPSMLPTPNLAQGGCQAIEDAYCLSLLMKKSSHNFSEIFPTYQSLREKKSIVYSQYLMAIWKNGTESIFITSC